MRKLLLLFVLFLAANSVHAEENKGDWIADAKTGCKAWNPVPAQDESITLQKRQTRRQRVVLRSKTEPVPAYENRQTDVSQNCSVEKRSDVNRSYKRREKTGRQPSKKERFACPARRRRHTKMPTGPKLARS